MKPWEMYKSSDNSKESTNIEQKPWEMYKTNNSIQLDLTGGEQLVTDNPNVVQSEDTKTTMTLQEVDQSIKQGETNEGIPGQVAAGMRQSVSLPLAKVVEDGLNNLGIDIGKESSENLEKINKYIKDYEDKNPDQLIHPATMGNIVSQLAVPIAKGTSAVVATEAILSTLHGIGKTNSYDNVAIDAALGAAFGYTGMKVIGLLPENIKSKLVGEGNELSKQAKLLLKLNQGRISEAEAIKMLKGIPKKDQTISLAESMDLAKNYFSRTVGDDSILAVKLGKRLEVRRNTFKPFIADEAEVQAAKQAYSDMKVNIDNASTGVYDTKVIRDVLDDKIIDTYATDPSGLGTAIKKIKLDTSEPITAGQALDIRENINELLRKPSIRKSFKTSKSLNEIKSSLDTFLDTTLEPQVRADMKQSINRYRETINRQKFGVILDKNTKADYAVNWEGVLKDIKKEGLGGKNTDFVVPILKEFEKKFSNDKYLAEAITPLGDSKNLSWLGVFSYAIGKVYDFASPVINKSRYKDVLIRDAIEKSIKKADPADPLKFVDDLVKDKHITLEQADIIKKESLAMIEYKPNSKTTGDVELTPKYSTNKGTIDGDPAKASLYDNQTNLVRESLGKGYSDEVITKVDAILTEQKINKIADRLKYSDTEQLKLTVRKEADNLVDIINKSVGVRLPKDEVEKIYTIKLEKAMGLSAIGTAAISDTIDDPNELALQNVLKYESDKLEHGDGITTFAGIDYDNLDIRVLKAIGHTKEDLKDINKVKEIGTKYVQYKFDELNRKSPYSKYINSKLTNLVILNDYLIKNISTLDTKAKLDNYLLNGTKSHKFIRSPEAKRNHKTLIDLRAYDDKVSGVAGWLYDKYGKSFLQKTLKTLDDKKEFSKAIEPYLEGLNSSDRVTLKRRLGPID